MKKFIAGTLAFHKNVRAGHHQEFAELANSQSPQVLFVACSDSRVMPNLFTSTDPGDFFTMRNVGNLIPAFRTHEHEAEWCAEWAAIEYGVKFLKISDVIICGHSCCGAMQSVIAGSSPPGLEHVRRWLQHARPSYQRFLEADSFLPNMPNEDRLSQINVLQQMDHLSEHPLVAEAVASGKLRLHGWWFDIKAASVLVYNPDDRRFNVLDEKEANRLYYNLLNGEQGASSQPLS